MPWAFFEIMSKNQFSGQFFWGKLLTLEKFSNFFLKIAKFYLIKVVRVLRLFLYRMCGFWTNLCAGKCAGFRKIGQNRAVLTKKVLATLLYCLLNLIRYACLFRYFYLGINRKNALINLSHFLIRFHQFTEQIAWYK